MHVDHKNEYIATHYLLLQYFNICKNESVLILISQYPVFLVYRPTLAIATYRSF